MLQRREYDKVLQEVLKFHTPLYAWKTEAAQAMIGEAEPFKTGMDVIGRSLGSVRPPQLPLSMSQKEFVRELIYSAGLVTEATRKVVEVRR